MTIDLSPLHFRFERNERIRRTDSIFERLMPAGQVATAAPEAATPNAPTLAAASMPGPPSGSNVSTVVLGQAPLLS